ncbi:MAG: hypothetical protein CMH55_10580 [Myxococcales bacterium]|nr:hypothetical protein [Myxococcales bacterium]
MSSFLSTSLSLLLMALVSLTPTAADTNSAAPQSEANDKAAPTPPAPDLLEWVVVNKSLEASRSEVTVKAYRACVDAGACDVPDDGGYCNWGRSDRDKHPINCVDWFQARQFAAWVEGRLPTAKEWVQLTGKSAFPWGDTVATCDYAAMTERTERCAGPGTSPVCSHPMGHSKRGLCDLAGNVWEWTDDGREPTADGAPEVLREQLAMGGAYYSMADELGRAGRMWRLPGNRGTGGIGLRVLRPRASKP